MNDKRIPVTILTGFLGSGKTTLLNRILTENHGMRIAVIENEFGEIGIDNDLVINAEEEVFEMNNGCICCTVRGDLIRILGNLAKKRDKFDYILVETTGLADPAPVAQTFYVDDEVKDVFRLDGIVTLVDSKHIRDHIEDSSECKEQLAFADVILLNKTDLVEENDLSKLDQKIHLMNSEAKVFRTVNAATDIKHLLKIGGFDIDRALEIRPSFLEPEFPFEWAGTLHLNAGNYSLRFQPGPDPSIKLFIAPSLASGEEAISLLRKNAILAFSAKDEILLENGKAAHPGGPLTLKIEESNSTAIDLLISEAGNYVFFSEHHPHEFEMELKDHKQLTLSFAQEKAFKPEHEHEEDITSVGVEFPGLLDPRVFQPWISLLLKTKGADIFRSKGVLHFVGEPRRYVFQGVHMLMKGEFDEVPTNGHLNRLVFIGRNLDRTTLVEGFKACLAKT